jgi:hypothetical protein
MPRLSPPMSSDDEIDVVIPPLPGGTTVDYLQEYTLPVLVTNNLGFDVLVTAIRIRPKPEWDSVAGSVIIEVPTPGFRIRPHKQDYRTITLTAQPLVMAGTNDLDLVVHYQLDQEQAAPRSFAKMHACYIVAREPPVIRGQIFISVKSPEDRELALILKTIVRRCAFAPYLADEDPHPGTPMWEEKIPPAIAASRALASLWTKNTVFGTGVRRELEIAEREHVHVIPFLERGAAVPAEYSKKPEAERIEFERESAAPVFARAIAALVLASSALT